MSALVAASLTALAVVAYALIKRVTRPSLPKIRGPEPSSFLLGNLLEIFRAPAGQIDCEWHSQYGDVVRFKSVFGVDQLMIADPKALQRIFNSSAYRFPKPPSIRVLTRMTNGRGIVYAEGEDHKRHRKVLVPGFGGPESKAFLGIFRGCAESMCMRWMEIVGNCTDQKAIIDISGWLSRGMLDSIGQAAFDVQFGAISNDANPLAKVYKNVVHEVFGQPSAQQVFVHAASMYVPTWILEWMTDHGSNPRLQRARKAKEAATNVAKQLVREKAESLLAGKQNRDVFSLLVKANMDTDAKNKLTEEELLAQMRTIIFAGHETTANTLNWILLELARHPKSQSRLRAEIREMEAAIRARGDMQFTAADLDALPYLTAVIKEGLRYHPVIARVVRMASVDEVLPLARPVTTESGEVINELFVPKGTEILASIAAYNRDKGLWGEDAHEFNPDRWLNGVASEKKAVQIGIYANLMTFIGGVRGCLGWRFAVVEIQAFLVEILNRFEFTMTERAERVIRGPSGLMTPLIEGELELGSQMPLAVSIARREDND